MTSSTTENSYRPPSSPAPYRETFDERLDTPEGRGCLLVIMKHPGWRDRPNASLDEARKMGNELRFSELCVVDLFARRARSIRELESMPYDEAVGEDNDLYISMGAEEADLIVAAWGAPNGASLTRYRRRTNEVADLVGADRLTSFGVTHSGHPRGCLDWRFRGRERLGDWSLDGVTW